MRRVVGGGGGGNVSLLEVTRRLNTLRTWATKSDLFFLLFRNTRVDSALIYSQRFRTVMDLAPPGSARPRSGGGRSL